MLALILWPLLFPGSDLTAASLFCNASSESVKAWPLGPHGWKVKVKVKVAQLCPTLWDPMDYSSWNFPGQNTRVGSLSLLQGYLLDSGIEPRSPTLQADSLPAESQGKPKNTGVGSLSLLQRIFLTQGLNWGLLHCRRILYQMSYEGRPHGWKGMRYWWNRASQVA